MAAKYVLLDHARKLGIPDYMQDSLVEYVLNGRPVGNFLTAVLSNDLKEACARADATNQYALPSYVKFLYNHAPMGCWGSYENIESWIERGGLMKISEEDAV